jgi:hypothetical protein
LETERKNMKSVLIITTLAISSAVYSKTPELPTPQKGKYAVQLIKVLTPSSNDPMAELGNIKKEKALFTTGSGENETRVYSANSITLPDPDKILSDANTEIFEYPILYIEAGSSVTNDQTKTVSLPQDYKVEDGKVIPLDWKLIKLGLSIATTVSEQKNGVVDLNLDFYTNEIKEFEELDIGSDFKVKVPLFNTRKFDTDVSVPLGSWTIMSGLKNEDTSKTLFYFVRVI